MRKQAVAFLTAATLLGGAVTLAAGGGADDPLVSKNYADGTYATQALTQAEARIDTSHDAVYQAAAAKLKGKADAYAVRVNGSTAGGSDTAAFTGLRFKQGDVIQVSAGSGFLLLAGSASASCSAGVVVDLAVAAQSAQTELTTNHRYLAVENTVADVTITSPTAVLALEGVYGVQQSDCVDYNELADALKTMGLFRGSDTGYGSGYDLEQVPTRIQGLIMFLRLIGEEQAALQSKADCPFTDVPDWCRPYVAYAWEKGYTKGMDSAAKIFGTNIQIRATEFTTFLLRALGYSDSGASPEFTWNTAIDSAVDFGVLTNGERDMLENQPFLRAQVVYLSYFGLDAVYCGTEDTLCQRLIATGVVESSAVAAVQAKVSTPRLT
jgi:hypothetical protein